MFTTSYIMRAARPLSRSLLNISRNAGPHVPSLRNPPFAAFSSSHKMSALKPGDKFPSDVVFSYVPWKPETAELTSCGMPVNYKASDEFKDKKVVLFAVPGAFTPGCSVRHLPPFIENLETLKQKADVVGVLAANDAFVMSAWQKANGIKNDDIYFFSDPELKFVKSIGWNMGERSGRWAMSRSPFPPNLLPGPG